MKELNQKSYEFTNVNYIYEISIYFECIYLIKITNLVNIRICLPLQFY